MGPATQFSTAIPTKNNVLAASAARQVSSRRETHLESG
jgi:hypothetical protein